MVKQVKLHTLRPLALRVESPSPLGMPVMRAAQANRVTDAARRRVPVPSEVDRFRLIFSGDGLVGSFESVTVALRYDGDKFVRSPKISLNP